MSHGAATAALGSAVLSAMLTVAVAAGPAQAQAQANAPAPDAGKPVFGPDHKPVADAALAEMRGGMELPGGIVDIGLTVDGTIKRAEAEDVGFVFDREITGGATQFSVNGDPITDGAFETDDGNVRVSVTDTPDAVTTVVQGGGGNTVGDAVADGASGVITAVQNNLNNVSIGVTNSIEVQTTKDLGRGSKIGAAIQRVVDTEGLR